MYGKDGGRGGGRELISNAGYQYFRETTCPVGGLNSRLRFIATCSNPVSSRSIVITINKCYGVSLIPTGVGCYYSRFCNASSRARITRGAIFVRGFCSVEKLLSK